MTRVVVRRAFNPLLLLSLWCLLLIHCCRGYIPKKQIFCDNGDPDLVMRQWRTVFRGDIDGANKLTLVRELFKEFTRRMPEVKENGLFDRVHGHNQSSPIYQAHLLRVTTSLDLLISSLKSDMILHWHVEWLSIKHLLQSKIEPRHFLILKEVLLETLPKVISPFNIDAWDNCLTPLMKGISALNRETTLLSSDFIDFEHMPFDLYDDDNAMSMPFP